MRTASSPVPRRDGCSSLSSLSSSVSQLTARKAFPWQDTSIKTASRWKAEKKKVGDYRLNKYEGKCLFPYLYLSQISCLGIEDCCLDDLCRLVLTSRNVDGSMQRFILRASTPEIRMSWANDIIQMLETQRNFLNGISIIISMTLVWPCHRSEFLMDTVLFHLLHNSSAVSYWIPEKRN